MPKGFSRRVRGWAIPDDQSGPYQGIENTMSSCRFLDDPPSTEKSPQLMSASMRRLRRNLRSIVVLGLSSNNLGPFPIPLLDAPIMEFKVMLGSLLQVLHVPVVDAVEK